MKNNISYSFLILLSISLMSATCSSDDDPINNNDNEIQLIKNNVENDTWKITSFIDSGQDESNHFTGYNFTFESNGNLIANNGSNVASGTWSVTNSNSNDDSSNSNDIDFNILFQSPTDFTDLSEDWNIVSQSSSKIELIHISGGNGGTDTLIFQKN